MYSDMLFSSITFFIINNSIRELIISSFFSNSCLIDKIDVNPLYYVYVVRDPVNALLMV